MAAIDVLDPFNFGQTIVDTAHGVGGFGKGEDVQLGGSNITDPSDTTLITVPATRRAAFAAGNLDGDGAAGVLGRSGSGTREIGTAGQCSTGAGVYGITTDESGSGLGIGVVGGAMACVAVETEPIENIVGQPTGVLGHSINGPGARGHGGLLLTLPQVNPAPGGGGEDQESKLLASCGPQRLFRCSPKTGNSICKTPLSLRENVG